MSEQTMYQTPQMVTHRLDISSATLRRWSEQFAEYLSEEAGTPQGRAHRRYNEHDLTILETIQGLMNQGMTYEQVRQELTDAPSRPQVETVLDKGGEIFDNGGSELESQELDEKGLIASNGDVSPAIAFLTSTLGNVSDNQKAILNSQAANRELLGVLIQDNFNLKEENSRLRDRVQEVERTLNQVRQEEEWKREALRQEFEAKFASVQQLATQAMQEAQSVEVPEVKTVKSKPGCLGALFGASGDVQVVMTPRKKGQAKPKQQASSPGSNSASPSQPAHPKPSVPPE